MADTASANQSKRSIATTNTSLDSAGSDLEQASEKKRVLEEAEPNNASDVPQKPKQINLSDISTRPPASSEEESSQDFVRAQATPLKENFDHNSAASDSDHTPAAHNHLITDEFASMSGSVAEGVSTRSGSAKGNRDMSAVDQTVKQVIAERGGRPVASSTEEFVTPMDDEARRAFVAQRKASKTVRLREARKEGRTRPASKPRAVQSTTSQTPAKKASPSSIAQKLAQQKINEARQQERRQLAARTNPLEYRSQLEQRLVKDPKSPGGVDRTSRRRVKAVKRRQRIARNELKAFEIELAIAAKEGVVLPAELAVQA